MSINSRIRAASVVVAEKIRRGDTVSIPAEILADLEKYVQEAAEARLRGDVEAFKSAARKAGRSGAQIQLALPGMEHASLPAIVFIKDPDTGEDQGIPIAHATKAQIRAEVAKHRRAVAVQDRIVAGWEAALQLLDSLDVPDDWTGAEIEAAFPKELDE